MYRKTIIVRNILSNDYPLRIFHVASSIENRNGVIVISMLLF